MHIKYVSIIFLQAPYMSRTIDVREPHYGHPCLIILATDSVLK
jgi:hypothetical protein